MTARPDRTEEARAILASAKRLVIKVGSRLLAEGLAERVAALAAEVAELRKRGIEVVLVSSGAIALGMARLSLTERPKTIPHLQATAAVGQGHLFQHYDLAFSKHGLQVGQVLLTHADLSDRGRFLNARHALSALLSYGAVPIINENDPVAVEEIKFGDNDQLAALVANLVEADALIVLTDVAGLLGVDGVVIPQVTNIDVEAVPLVGTMPARDRMGSGGMASKVQAAKIVGQFGIPTLVAPGRQSDVLRRVLSKEPIGTLFIPKSRDEALPSRKHWIAYALRPSGTLKVDAGAVRALREQKRSLLASGIIEVRGRFALGEAVAVAGPDGQEFARGLAGYDSEELQRIAGLKSSDIEAVLGYKYFDEVIHRDDLVLL